MLEDLANRIAETDASLALQNTSFVVPLSQSLHIVGIAVLITCALTINARLLGIGARSRSTSDVITTALPWMWRALLLCALTGALQTFIEPLRQFGTMLYFYKMLLVAALAILTLWLQRMFRANASEWSSATVPASARSFAALSTVGWVTVIFLGRFIGYV